MLIIYYKKYMAVYGNSGYLENFSKDQKLFNIEPELKNWFEASGSKTGKSFNQLTDVEKSQYLMDPEFANKIAPYTYSLGELSDQQKLEAAQEVADYFKSLLPISYTAQPTSSLTDSTDSTNYDNSMADAVQQSLPSYNVFAKLSPTEQKDILINNPNIITPEGSQTYDAGTNTVRLNESAFTKNQRLDQERLAMQLSRGLSGNLPSTDNEAVRNATFQLGKKQLDPELKSQREALATQLANQGIPINSEAYNSAMNRLDRSQGDQLNSLSLQSLLTGIQTAEAQRAARFNEISSLLGRSQVGAGSSFGQMQSNYQGVDLMGAEQAALNRESQFSMLNKQLKSQMKAAQWQAAGSAIGGVGKAFSDIALKTNIQFENKFKNHLPIYTFEYINKKHGDGRFEGVMAQDVEKTYPQAVSVSSEGYKMVDYSQIGIEFRRV
tara:strand:- start:1764 stop:3077 length:1314 start_codon:yes stop_codon:yes gene_type:complete